jgi:hypothetical protein
MAINIPTPNITKSNGSKVLPRIGIPNAWAISVPAAITKTMAAFVFQFLRMGIETSLIRLA